VRGEPPFTADELQPGAADKFGRDLAYTDWRRPYLDLPE
jgi:hypothetical protein